MCWVGVCFCVKSCVFMFGYYFVCVGEFIVNGGFKIGFGMVLKVGEVVVDLILEN